jgi:tryptophan halogenase
VGEAVKKVIVLGSGSAGLLAALAMRKRHPDLPIVIIRSRNIPIIGVGEGATTPVTYFLHDFLNVNTKRLFQIAKPTWKLGIRFEWGARKTFYYPFHKSADLTITGIPRQLGFYADENLNYMDPYSALMAHDKVFARDGRGAPLMAGRHFAYHFENENLVMFLEALAAASGITTREGTVVDVKHDGTMVSGLVLESGPVETADLFIDCSGFVSALLGKTLREPFISYKSTLFCDRAVVGGWDRSDEVIRPYTTAETMNAGWCWQIEHENRINRGYVYSADFISDADAELEFRTKNPRLLNTRIVKFISGRYARTWVGNVVGIGNSAAFVEPLEATALGSICMQAQLLAESLVESDRKIVPIHASLYNDRIARNTDSIRRFLAVHYKFNTLLDTPFWKACRAKVDLAGAESIIEYYQQTGPGDYWQHGLVDPYDFATMTGYLQLLVGQGVPHNVQVNPAPSQRKILNDHYLANRTTATNGIGVKEMLQLTRDPRASWN